MSEKENYKNMLGTKLKTYLNAEENNNFFWLFITSLCMKQYRVNFGKHGTITSEEHKNLKMSETYLKKFISSVMNRLDPKATHQLIDRASKYEIKIIDQFTKRKLYGEWAEELEVIKMPREQYNNWCDRIMKTECKNCKKQCGQCELFELFEDTFIPESSWQLPNCKYAYNLDFDNENINVVRRSR